LVGTGKYPDTLRGGNEYVFWYAGTNSSGSFHSHKGRTVDKQRVSLTKKNLETASGKELLKLSKSIKSDGRLSKDEVVNLVNWLNANKACGLPAVKYLYSVVKEILADKIISPSEMKELHLAIEKILPPEDRRVAVHRRKEIEKAAKQKEKEAARANKTAQARQEQARRWQERASRPRGFYSKVAGVTLRNDDGSDRQAIIRDYVWPGLQLIVKREPYNPCDEFAISLWVKAKTIFIFETERQIGYLNTKIAEELSPYLDHGGWAQITVKNKTGGGDHRRGVNIFIEDGQEIKR
jgi:hypothetical protein